MTFPYDPEDLETAVEVGGRCGEIALRERDRLQIRIADLVQKEGRFWVPAAPVPGGFALRLNVISWLTDETRVDTFLDELPR